MEKVKPKRIAVIGSGASGLTAMKCCLDEGLEPVCFERTEHIGGLWRYTDNPIEGQGCVMKSTVINTSKEIMAFSDYPIPAKFPIFMHNTQVYEYFKMYAEKFGLQKYIRFGTEVSLVTRADNFKETGQWEIKSRKRQTSEEQSEIFDGVMVCTGHHADKYEPTFPGLTNFKGKVVHTHDYRTPAGFEDKRVVIVGIGNSGGDIAVELSRISKQVFLSTRRGTWILNRIGDGGMPIDMLLLNRAVLALQKFFPKAILEFLAQRKLNAKVNHKLYSLQPEYGVFAQHPMVNDDMPNRIVCGAIKIKTDIKQITETSVEFVDGTVEENIDTIILATGYSFGFPFIDKSVIDVQDNRVQLFKYMYPPDLEHPTLAVIGCFQPIGAIMPISEMQCRLAARVFKDESILPSRGKMWEDIRNKEAEMAQRYTKSRRHTIQVDFIQFLDELAALTGNTYDIWNITKRDPKLGFNLMFGPVTPYHYRLCGPGKWSGAREAILTQWDRTTAPLQSRKIPSGLDKRNWAFIASLFIALYFIIRFFIF